MLELILTMSLQIYPGLLSSSSYFTRLNSELSWVDFTPFSKPLRQCASMTQCELLERYPDLTEIVQSITSQSVVGAFVNKYRNGRDHAPFHRDAYGVDTVVLSFGGSRDFHYKKKSEVEKYVLNDGDVLFFPQSVNLQGTHSIPQRAHQNNPRISMLCFLS
jgi:alkylated DNA repair dioxygenase AlkB